VIGDSRLVDFDSYLAHAPQGISWPIEEYATDVVFEKSRYIFTHRVGNRQRGYCTHCKREFDNEQTLKHGYGEFCPCCYSKCIVKASGRGRKDLIDKAHFVFYEKSAINPQAIIARMFLAIRDYSQDYMAVETQYGLDALYIFEPGSPGVMLKKSCYYYGGLLHNDQFVKAATVYTLPKYNLWYSRESIEAAVAGTPFQYSTWAQYNTGCMVAFFDLAARYRCIEYLTKLGFKSLVITKLNGESTHSAINWNGKNVLKVLRLTKKELNEIREQKVDVTFSFLHILQKIKKLSGALAVSEVILIARDFGNLYYFEQLLAMLDYGPIKKILSYVDKQFSRDRKQYTTRHDVVSTWHDYLEDCKKLGMDLASESVIFPKSVYRSHQNYLRQIKIKSDEGLNQQIAKRIEELNKKYFFERDGLFIQPAADTLEMIDEGKALNHCVGVYAREHADGRTVILFVRKADEPDKPYFTVEVRPGYKAVFQVRGKANRPPDETVTEFIAAFTDERLAKKEKERIRIPA
jgi:hypothetical protein